MNSIGNPRTKSQLSQLNTFDRRSSEAENHFSRETTQVNNSPHHDLMPSHLRNMNSRSRQGQAEKLYSQFGRHSQNEIGLADQKKNIEIPTNHPRRG
eukprot:CAMPEP_0170502806 /NCGR_PEP_ID=MMETSP0208-20121228/42618_1 /TAXON_ID=197538 /ORGANISM="Strombidium inclinatum, Strain S3" /LENGTH=96 /DNA_ID=CAMNT_0010782085 /DNA_START=290 /DNA_END=576 /DNA_ORIENTATION=+